MPVNTFQDPSTRSTASKLLIVAGIIVFWEVIEAIIGFVQAGQSEAGGMRVAFVVLGLLVGIAIPSCAYFGVKNKSSDLLMWSQVCGWICTIFGGIVLIILIVGLSSLDLLEGENGFTSDEIDTIRMITIVVILISCVGLALLVAIALYSGSLRKSAEVMQQGAYPNQVVAQQPVQTQQAVYAKPNDYV